MSYFLLAGLWGLAGLQYTLEVASNTQFLHQRGYIAADPPPPIFAIQNLF